MPRVIYDEDAAVKKVNRKLRSFTKQMRKATKDLTEKQLVLFHKKVSLEALKRVMMKTPVDTGRARGNWQTTIGRPATGTIDNTKDSGAVPGDEPSNEDLADALAILQDLKPFSTVYIANNLDYIIYLEEGSSSQAPAGMVKVTIEELKEMIKR